CEERAGIKQLTIVNFLPLIGRAKGAIALRRQRVGCGTKPENVQQQNLVVTFIAILDESSFRKPAMSYRRCPVAGPIPVRSFVKCIRQCPNLNLVGCIAIEISADGKRTREQKSRVDGRKLTLPDAATCVDVQEMVEEAFIARSVRFRTLRALIQITKLPPREFCSEISK